MDFTKEQLSEVFSKHAERENGLQDLMVSPEAYLFLYIQKVNLPGEADVDDGLAQLGDVLGAATVDADVALSVVEGGVEADVTVTRERVVFYTAAGEP